MSYESTPLLGTIRENLLFANKAATQEEIEQALQQANANFVLTLPNGLDTHIDDGAESLSKGQKVRIALAQALIKKPKLLLLDDIYFGLDHQSEKELQSALTRLIGDGRLNDMTIIFVDQKLQNIKVATNLIHIKTGKLAQ